MPKEINIKPRIFDRDFKGELQKSLTLKETKPSWGEKFDKKFDIGNENEGIIFTDNKGMKRAIPLLCIKDFIRQTIQSEREQAVEKERERFLKIIDENYLNYCRNHNGLPYCKNCGLDVDELKDLISQKF